MVNLRETNVVKAMDDSMRACRAFFHEGQFNGLRGSVLQQGNVWGRLLSTSGVEVGCMVGRTTAERLVLSALSATTSELSLRGISEKLNEVKICCPVCREFERHKSTPNCYA